MVAKATKQEGVLRFADSALILSQRLMEWCGKGPVLEEDMALANTALDLLGQARLWLAYAAELDDKQRDEDQFAFLRDSRDYRNLLLVEQPNGNYAQTLVRQFFFDTWHHLALAAMVESSDEHVAGIAEKAIKEVTYHVRRSSDLIVRLGDGTEKSHALVQEAIDELWTYTGEMFVVDAIDSELASTRAFPEFGSLRQRWLEHVQQVFQAATLRVPAADAFMQSGGRQGRHTEKLGYLLAEMQILPRTYPGATW
jgi:ring-1,2-phenylacetyl-CoA epoxidase subunit PaaC